MIKTILLPMGGSESDTPVLDTALAVARPLGAHLECVHVKIDPGEAARFTPHVEFQMGSALHDAMRILDEHMEARSALAARHFRSFCAENGIAITTSPGNGEVTAAWREDTGAAAEVLLWHARHHDLVVIGRNRNPNGLPPDMLELLLLGGGSPVLIAPVQKARPLAGTVMLCWKEAAESARAVAAAMPLMAKAERVVIVSVAESSQDRAAGAHAVARQLGWHGIHAEVQCVAAGDLPPSQLLAEQALKLSAGLVVLGGYGHSRLRELVFGGWTRSALEDASVPVLIAH